MPELNEFKVFQELLHIFNVFQALLHNFKDFQALLHKFKVFQALLHEFKDFQGLEFSFSNSNTFKFCTNPVNLTCLILLVHFITYIIFLHYTTLHLAATFDSQILSSEPWNVTKILGEWLPITTGHWKACWRGTRDGWESSTFHSKCDGKVPTLVIVKVVKSSINLVFGGYANATSAEKGKFDFIENLKRYLLYCFVLSIVKLFAF